MRSSGLTVFGAEPVAVDGGWGVRARIVSRGRDLELLAAMIQRWQETSGTRPVTLHALDQVVSLT